MRIENERLKRALEVSLEQEWRTMPEESEICLQENVYHYFYTVSRICL